jgi:hypothetical protein
MSQTYDSQLEKDVLMHFCKKGKCKHCEWFLCDCSEHNWQWFHLLSNLEEYFIENPTLRPKNTNKFINDKCSFMVHDDYTQEFKDFAEHIRNILYDLSNYTLGQALNGIDINIKDNFKDVTNELTGCTTTYLKRNEYNEKYIFHIGNKKNQKSFYHDPYAHLLFECGHFKS